MRFEPAEPLGAYYDYMDLEDSAQRVATFIVHLSDVEAGGETFFHSYLTATDTYAILRPRV